MTVDWVQLINWLVQGLITGVFAAVGTFIGFQLSRKLEKEKADRALSDAIKLEKEKADRALSDAIKLEKEKADRALSDAIKLEKEKADRVRADETKKEKRQQEKELREQLLGGEKAPTSIRQAVTKAIAENHIDPRKLSSMVGIFIILFISVLAGFLFSPQTIALIPSYPTQISTPTITINASTPMHVQSITPTPRKTFTSIPSTSTPTSITERLSLLSPDGCIPLSFAGVYDTQKQSFVERDLAGKCWIVDGLGVKEEDPSYLMLEKLPSIDTRQIIIFPSMEDNISSIKIIKRLSPYPEGYGGMGLGVFTLDEGHPKIFSSAQIQYQLDDQYIWSVVYQKSPDLERQGFGYFGPFDDLIISLSDIGEDFLYKVNKYEILYNKPSIEEKYLIGIVISVNHGASSFSMRIPAIEYIVR